MAYRDDHSAGTSRKSLVKDDNSEEVLAALNPHAVCQECYYGYPYVLQRALKNRLEGSLHDPTYKIGQLSMTYADFIRTSTVNQAGSDNSPPPSETESKWKEALIHKKMPLLKLESNTDRSIPSLQYLSKLSLWESLRRYEDYQQEVLKLPVSEAVQDDLTKFIEREEVSLHKHLCLKVSQLLFCEEFLNSM